MQVELDLSRDESPDLSEKQEGASEKIQNDMRESVPAETVETKRQLQLELKNDVQKQCSGLVTILTVA